MSDPYQGLAPAALWRYFALVSRIPRCSGKEAQLRAALVELARERKLETRQDAPGNLVIVVPARPGCEAWPTVVLQGHLDMVCEQDAGSSHDFDKDGIAVLRDGEWLRAEGTTLGADNGVAVAAALALLDDPPAEHGPLELLFTVDEERGLSGAQGIEPQMLRGRLLINMDSEEEGFVTVGCAGGGDTTLELTMMREAVDPGWERARLRIAGLSGGHSGLDIHRNRANALRCLGLALDRLRRATGGLRLFALDGGSKRNAIPREARALVALPPGSGEAAAQLCGEVQRDLEREFAASDPELTLTFEPAPDGEPQRAFSEGDAARALALLLATPSGPVAMSREIVGLVETSNNLGVATTEGDTVRIVCCARSSVAPALEAVRQGLRALGEAVGARVELDQAYPGWQPNLASPLLATFKRVHRELLGSDAEEAAMHAGLECGILGERFPGMDMVSFGPTIVDVHSPGEKLSIPSTERFFRLLKGLLANLGPG